MQISGVLNKERFFAISIDSSIALIGTLFIMILVREIPAGVKGVIMVAVYLGYFIVFEGLWSRTPGKYHQGLIVRKLDGTKAGWKEAFARGVFIVLELNPFLFGGLPAGIAVLSSKRKQRIGDMLAGTVVVSDKLVWDSTDLEVEEQEVAISGDQPPS